MERLQVLNIDTVSREKYKPPVIRVSYGRIHFSIEAVKLFGLNVGDRISFYLDKNDKGIVYFKKDPKGFELNLDFSGITGTRLRIFCRPAADKIMQHFQYGGAKTFTVSSEQADVYGEKMWFILKSNKK